MKPQISVVIPTYNRSSSVASAGDSVRSQILVEPSIIIADDGSTDQTHELLKRMYKSYKRITYLSGEHTGGPAAPRNRGIRAAHTEWIAFLDSDDIWLRDKITKQIKYAYLNGYDMVCTNAYRIIGKKKTLFFPPTMKNGQLFFNDLLADNKVICSTVLVKKSVIDDVGGFPEEMKYNAIEDYLVWLKIATKYRIGFLSEPLIEYKDDPSHTIRSAWIGHYAEQRKTALRYILHWMLTHIHYTSQYIGLCFQILRAIVAT